MRRALSLKLVGALSMTALLGAAPGDAPVADAARRGDAETVRALLQQGADANAAHGDGMTALHWAADRGDTGLAEMLVYAGADVAAVTRIGHYTPLHLATRSGNAPVAALLLKSGADVSATTTNSGVTALHLAAASGRAEVVSLLLDHGADVNAREAQWGQTPLIFAAAQNRVEAIRVLLARGADPGVTTSTVDVVTLEALDKAAIERQREVLDAFRGDGREAPTPAQVEVAVLAARELYLSGKLPEKEGQEGERDDDEQPDRPSVTSKGGLTALLHAARQGYTDAALALLDGGADIDQVGAGDATSPLLMATINGHFDLAMLLIERGANPNLAASINGATPLWAAVNAQWQPRTRFPQPQEQELQRATYLDVMRALLEAGADPDARLRMHPWYMVYSGCGNRNCGLADTEGSTAFWRAAYATDVEAMRLLVAHGADPNLRTVAPPPPRRRGPPREDRAPTSTPPATGSGQSAQPPAERAEAPRDEPRDASPRDPVPPEPPRRRSPTPSALPVVPPGGPGVAPIHAAAGVGYGEGFAGNAHRHAPDSWLPAVKYLIEELGADVNARDHNGYTALHHAASRGDNALILYLVEKGADVTVVSRQGQTTADMANGPVQRVSPFPETVALLEQLGSRNSNNCVSC